MNPKWKLMETNLAEPLSTLIFMADNNIQTKTPNHAIRNTFKIWKTICKTLKVKDQEMACLREMSCDQDFTPNSFDSVFKIWGEKGLTRFHQMYNKDGVASFEHIVDQYGIPRNHFFRYLQVRSYLKDTLKI